MATIHNSELQKELIKGAKIQLSQDAVPNEIAGKIVPVMEVNPRLLRSANIFKQGTSSGTLYTTPTTKDFYLTGYSLSAFSAAVAGNMTINFALPGETSSIKDGLYTPANADIHVNTSVTLNPPVKIEKGTAISMGYSNTVYKSMSIIGYTVEE